LILTLILFFHGHVFVFEITDLVAVVRCNPWNPVQSTGESVLGSAVAVVHRFFGRASRNMLHYQGPQVIFRT
jgi:hypothetical protein